MSAEPAPGGPTRWGVWLHGLRPVPELAALAREAEQHGAAAVFLADELLDRDIYVTFAAIAAATEHVLLVPAITNPHSRHPVATAAALASLAEVAPGRVVAGLGAGGSLVFGPLGLRPAQPYTALVETLDVVERLTAGERVDHTGQFTVSGAGLPWSPGPLPTALAGRGPRVERLAAERADWMILAGKPLDDLPSLVAQVRAEPTRRAAGRPPARIAWNPAAAWREQDVEAVRTHFAYMTVDMPAAWRRRTGVGDDVVEALRAALAAGGPEAARPLVPQAVLDAFALVGERPRVVSRLAGLVEEVRPELVVLGLSEYSPEFVAQVAAVCAEAGIGGAA